MVEPRKQLVPYQWVSDQQLAALGATRAACAMAVHFVDREGVLHVGAEAANSMLRASESLRGIVRLVERPLLDRQKKWRTPYRFVATHRSTSSRILGSVACALITERRGGDQS
jgi:hypothetical protein